MDSMNDQYSIKNLLFSKAIPNYVIPVPTAGHKIYACLDCGDKFLVESSYDYHINRKSVKISYFCRLCNGLKVFYNRCNLLSHIRSHAFKTATINVSDLKLDPLPLKYYNKRHLTAASNALSTSQDVSDDNQTVTCFECNTVILTKEKETPFKLRVKHFMTVLDETYSCIVCLYTLPTPCALKAHMRFHFKAPPYFCPECGMSMTQRSTNYPYDHKCEGFMMMRATARLKCSVPECNLVHPSQYKDHIKKNHLKIVYKCPFCFVACFDEAIMTNHLKNHKLNRKHYLTFYQCEICPGKLVLQSQIESHCKIHLSISHNYVYPCWSCGKVFKYIIALAAHHVNTHNLQESIKMWLKNILKTQNPNKEKKIYRVVKRCDQCKRSFSYKCKFEQIKMLPIECPYKCTPTPAESSSKTENELLTCHMCKNKISQNWDEIKKHFNEFHKTHRCVDVNVIVPKLSNIEKYLQGKKLTTVKNRPKKSIFKRKRPKRNQDNKEKNIRPNTNEFSCKKCGYECGNRELLEKHLITHRDPCMAYQCMECGQCFVVKPSFSKHLLLEHNISNCDGYIAGKQCYNESALLKYQDNPVMSEPLRENQCKICREQYENASDLEKHFRVHGMAFLMQNNSNKTISP